MIQKRMKLSAFLLALMLILTGCAPEAPEEGRAAMGRYVEEELPLPEEIATLRHIGQMPDGSFLVLGTGDGETLDSWQSHDGGESWRRGESPWLETLRAYDVEALAVDGEGGLWFTHIPEDDPEEGEEPTYPLVSLCDGVLREWELPLQNREGINAQHFQVAGDFLAACYGRELAVYRLSEERLLWKLPADRYLDRGDYLLDGEALALVEDSSIRLFRGEDGIPMVSFTMQEQVGLQQKSDFFDFASRQSAVAGTPGQGVLAYCNSSGLYRIATKDGLHEKILAGELTSLVQPAVSIQRLFLSGDDYYVYVTGRDSMPWNLSGAALLRYRHDGTVPAVPTTELRVFALGDAPTVRQAAGIFQREHPAVRVRLEIAADGVGAATLDDVQRTLSTQLLAGSGPDILILDGLPVERYVEQGVLLDLSGLLSPAVAEDLLPRLREAYRGADGVVYAVPGRFTVPMLLAGEGELVDTLPALAEAVAALDSPQLGYRPDQLGELLYRTFHREWFDPEGFPREEELRRGLEAMEAILGRYRGMDEGLLWNTEGDARVGAIGWMAGWTPFYLGELTALEHLSGPYTAGVEMGAVYRPYPSEDQAGLHPQIVAGVNASGAQTDLAVQFVECMLSLPVQRGKLGDGLPVSRQALRLNTVDTETRESPRYGVSFRDEFLGGAEKGLTVPLPWPDEAYFDGFLAAVEGLPVLAPADRRVMEIVLGEAEAYFDGRTPLEEAVAQIVRKLELSRLE